jgi:hypothetical protein
MKTRRIEKMVRQRTPINRIRHTQEFTPEIIDAFTNLRKVFERSECTCPPVEPRPYPEPRCTSPDGCTFGKTGYCICEPEPPPLCSACKDYKKAEGEVIGLFNFKPWEFLANPYFGNPYPPESHAWKRREEERRGNGNKPISAAYALWWRLEKAAGLEPLTMDEET